MQLRNGGSRWWEAIKQQDDPEVVAFTERLTNLLEPDLDKCGDSQSRIQTALRQGLLATLRKAGASQFSKEQLELAHNILCSCWNTEYCFGLNQVAALGFILR